MQPKKHHETPDLFRSRLDQILNLNYPLFKLADQIGHILKKSSQVLITRQWADLENLSG